MTEPYMLKSIVVHEVQPQDTDEEILAWAANFAATDLHIPAKQLSLRFSLKREGTTVEIFMYLDVDPTKPVEQGLVN